MISVKKKEEVTKSHEFKREGEEDERQNMQNCSDIGHNKLYNVDRHGIICHKNINSVTRGNIARGVYGGEGKGVGVAK